MDGLSFDLCQELHNIARSPPGGGEAALWRVTAICQQLYDRHPNLQLLERVRRVQGLMTHWSTSNGWEAYGSTPEALRSELLTRIAKVLECNCFADSVAQTPCTSLEAQASEGRGL